MHTLPQIGELVTVAGITFPLTLKEYTPATKSASLFGEHPETGMEVVLPRVCLSLLHPFPAQPVVEEIETLVESLEQDLFFAGFNCSQATIHVSLNVDGEERWFKVQSWQIRHRVLDALIDGIGAKLEEARKEAAEA